MPFPPQNNTNFPQALKNILGNLKYNDKTEFLKFHQYLVKEYASMKLDDFSFRGLMMYFEVGFGKTILAIALALLYKKIDKTKKIIVLLSKGLIQNFKDNIKKFLRDNPEFKELGITPADINKHFKFISFRSNLMYKKIAELDKTVAQEEFEEQIGKISEEMKKDKDFLENSVLIVDEAHNFTNAITNGSVNSVQLYDTIMTTKNIKLFLLTGTPIINDPFELVPAFNMLKGKIKVDRKISDKRPVYVTLFPESRGEFENYFIERVDMRKHIKNKSRFQNRIMGLTTYYGTMYFEEKNPDYPEQLPTKVEVINMSPEQYSKYDSARDIEKEEASYKKKRPSKSARFAKSDSSSTYRIRTRQISNFVFPDHALGPKRGKKMRKKFIHKLTDSDWESMNVLSPKMVKIYENIKTHGNELGMVYTEFVTGEGIAIFEEYLRRNGYKHWEDGSAEKELEENYGVKRKGGKIGPTYAIITGQLDIDERARIQEVFNSSDNRKGGVITLLLVNKIAAEGLDLKGLRHIHIMEPFWNYSRIEQVIGRGVRYKSHTHLPKNEQNVQPYVYLSDYPVGFPESKKKEKTTDIEMYDNVMDARVLNDEFKLAIVESSLDCLVHSKSFTPNIAEKIKCKLCSPTDAPLYNPVLSKDLSVSDPCLDIKESKVQAKEIIDSITGDKYAYQLIDPNSHSSMSEGQSSLPEIQVFKFEENLNGYVPVNANNPAYGRIVRKVLNL